MSIIQEPHIRCKGKSPDDEYRSRVFHDTPALGRLLDSLDAGTTPTFLDIMTAISEMVAFHTNPDLLESDESVRFPEMSQKNCRFCC